MYIFVRKVRASKKIKSVDTLGFYKNKTLQEVLDAIEKFNSENHECYYEAINVESEDASEVLKFLLGMGEHRISHTISDVLEKISDLDDTLEDIERDISSLQSNLARIRYSMENIKEE